jgi:Uma2 family endonuclease
MSSRLGGDPFEEDPVRAALNLSDDRVWTADDVAKLPEDLPYELIDGRAVRDRQDKMKLYSYAGIPAYWIVDPTGERVTFTEWPLSEGGAYHQHVHTDGLVTIDRPWVTTLDLPAWTRRRDELRDGARPNG